MQIIDKHFSSSLGRSDNLTASRRSTGIPHTAGKHDKLLALILLDHYLCAHVINVALNDLLVPLQCLLNFDLHPQALLEVIITVHYVNDEVDVLAHSHCHDVLGGDHLEDLSMLGFQ